VQVDLSPWGGAANCTVVNSVIQEVDILTNNLVFEWNSAAHVQFNNTYVSWPTTSFPPWQWFHANAVKVDDDGNLLINSRFTWSVYKVDRKTGNVLWTLGGKSNNFHGESNWRFAWQHDPIPLGFGEYLIFDNELMSRRTQRSNASSRAIRIRVSEEHHSVQLISESFHQPKKLFVPFQGSVQLCDNATTVVGWGAKGYMSVITNGKQQFSARLQNAYSNRIYFIRTLPTQLLGDP
jgi:hypothetical protein